jgi:hypothetical protein
LNASFWGSAAQQHDGARQYKAAGASGGELAQSGNVIFSWDGTPSADDGSTVEGCLLQPASSRRATKAERSAIVHAIHADKHDFEAVKTFRVTEVRFSGHDPSFAMTGVFSKVAGGAAVLLHNFQGRWRVLTLGTELPSCGLPNQVAVDLGGEWRAGPCT